MDKNTVLALILCILVIVGTAVVNIMVVKPRQEAARKQQQVELAQKEAEQKKKVEEANKQVSTLPSENQEETITPASETDLTITTDKVKVLFSQKGGDIVSYQLLEHFDKECKPIVSELDKTKELSDDLKDKIIDEAKGFYETYMKDQKKSILRMECYAPLFLCLGR